MSGLEKRKEKILGDELLVYEARNLKIEIKETLISTPEFIDAMVRDFFNFYPYSENGRFTGFQIGDRGYWIEKIYKREGRLGEINTETYILGREQQNDEDRTSTTVEIKLMKKQNKTTAFILFRDRIVQAEPKKDIIFSENSLETIDYCRKFIEELGFRETKI